MAFQREMDLIVSLRNSTKNSPEMKKLENSIKALHKLSESATKTLGSQKARKEMQALKKTIDGVVKSLQNLSKGKKINFSDLQKGIKSALDIINKLIEATKREKKELGNLAREDIGKLQNNFINLQKTLENFENELDRAIVSTKIAAGANEILTASLQKEATAAQSLGNEYQRLINRLYSYNRVVLKRIAVTNQLGESLRKIQVIGDLKGVSLFKQSIQSTQVFQAELEKLRVRLAKVLGTKVTEGGSIGKDMIETFGQIEAAIASVEGRSKKLQKVFGDFEKAHVILERLSKAHSELSIESNSVLQSMIEKYEKTKLALKEVLETMGAKNLAGINSFSRLKTEVNKSLAEIRESLKNSGITAVKISDLYSESILKIEENLIKFSQASFKVWAGSKEHTEGAASALEETNQKVLKLVQAFGKFKKLAKSAESGVISLKVAQEAANKVLEMANDVIGRLGSKYQENVKIARETARVYLGTADTAAAAVQYLRTKLKDLSMSIAQVIQEERTLATASEYLADSQFLLQKQVDAARRKAELFSQEVFELSAKLNILKKNSDKNSDSIQRFTSRLKFLQAQSKKASDHLAILNDRLMQAGQKVGDASRAMSRMGAQGFANMIISQAAWMAGFQLIFGTLDRFKKAMAAVLETQLAVSRAMRTIRSETHSTAEIYDQLTDAVNRMRMSVGASATETGEALYQLGSAGLHLNESLAALAPTMDTVIGAEADMEQITNLVAGVYNNFGDQIVKINGQVRTISRTFAGYNTSLIESTTLTEKFRKINDLLVRTFDAHQAEMDQIRDGLKFMAQSAMQANLSLTQQLGILATLHDHFIKAGAAGRGMRVIISRISKEAEKFRDAFDLDIDLNAPIDMIDIFGQLHNQMEEGILSVEKLGIFFQRLGLRGVEPLLVLIQNFDELNDNIKDLAENSEDASRTMRLLRLANLGDQAKIASGKIEVLIKAGLQPLATMLGIVVAGFNKISDAVVITNDAVGGFLGLAVRFVGLIATIKLITVLWRNQGEVFSWVFQVFKRLWKTFKDFGALGEETKGKLLTLGGAVSAVGRRFTEFFGTLKKGYADVRTGGMEKGMGRLKAAITLLTGSIAGLGVATKALLVVAAAFAFYKLIDYIGETNNRLRALVKTQRDKLRVDKVALKTLKEEAGFYRDITEVTKENEHQVRALAAMTGVYARTLDDLNTELGSIQTITKIHIQQQEEMFKIDQATYFVHSLELIQRNIKEITIYGKTGVSIWEKLWMVSKEIFSYIPVLSSIPGAFKGLVDIAKKGVEWGQKFLGVFKLIVDWVGTKITGALDQLNQKLEHSYPIAHKVFSFLYNSSEKNIQKFVKLNKEYAKLSDTLNNHSKELAKINHLMGTAPTIKAFLNHAKTRAALIKLIETEKEELATIGKKRTALIELLKKSGDYEKALLRIKPTTEEVITVTKKLTEEWEKAGKSNEKTMSQFVDSFKRLSARLNNTTKDFRIWRSEIDKVDKQIKLDRFNAEIDKIMKKLKTVSAKAPKVFYEMAKAITAATEEAGTRIDNLRQEIDRLSRSIRSLDDEQHALKMDQFNREVQDSKDTLSSLQRQFDFAGKKAKKFKKDTSDLSSGMEMVTGATSQFGSAMMTSSTSLDQSSKSVKKSNKLTKEQEKIKREMVEKYGEEISGIQGARQELETHVGVKKEEIKANGETLKGLEANRKVYQDLGKDLDGLKGKAAENRDATIERIKAERELKSISESEKTRQLLKAEKDYQNEIAEIAKRRAFLEKDRLANIDRIRKAERGEQGRKQQELDTLIAKMKELVKETNKVVIKIGKEKVIKEIKEIREEWASVAKDPVSVPLVLDTKEALVSLEEFHKNIETEIPKVIIDANTQKAVDKIKDLNQRIKKEEPKPVNDSSIIAAIKKANELHNNLKRPVTKTVRIKVIGDKVPGNYFGGVIKRAEGGIVPARVTAGEGFIPPGQTRNNLNMLNTLNSGRIPSKVPSSIGSFQGPGGVDNIHTFLPVGSYVLSKKGMEAYERSINQGTQTFQEGGEVASTESPPVLTSATEESVGSFTIIVEKEGISKEFPITGKVSVLKSLRDELEEDRLTRLH